MKDLVSISLPNGGSYRGFANTVDGKLVPNGTGFSKYPDHYEAGTFRNGLLDGLSYYKYAEWMIVGMSSKGEINGWAFKKTGKRIVFGIFEHGILRVGLTPLIIAFAQKALEVADEREKGIVWIRANGDILVGNNQDDNERQFGFYFVGSGEVYLGVFDYDHQDITGKFLHFDKDFNINIGEYNNGKLVRSITKLDIANEFGAWADYRYFDFDISMNYAPSSFLLKKTKMMHIIDIGKTDSNLIVKANTGEIKQGQLTFQQEENRNTAWFLFPINNPAIEKEFHSIIHEDHPWVPNFNDYRVEFKNNIQGSNHLAVYKHISCWDSNADYKLDVFAYKGREDYADLDNPKELLYYMIPNYLSKAKSLSEQWLKEGWNQDYPSLRAFVFSLCDDEEERGFWGWLFDDPLMNGFYHWSLPTVYESAFEQFLLLFPEDNRPKPTES